MKLNLLSYFQKLIFIFSYLSNKSFSENLFLRKILISESVVLDVGSNLGSFISTVKKINKKISIHSIEPNLELLKFQQKKFLNSNNITFHNFAIDSKSGQAKFYFRDPPSHSSLSENHIDSKFNSIDSIQNVTTITVSSFLAAQGIKEVALLKLDTEGNDFKILNSCEELISKGIIKNIKIEATVEDLESIIDFSKNNNLKIIGISNVFHFKNLFRMLDLYLENNNINRE